MIYYDSISIITYLTIWSSKLIDINTTSVNIIKKRLKGTRSRVRNDESPPVHLGSIKYSAC